MKEFQKSATTWRRCAQDQHHSAQAPPRIIGRPFVKRFALRCGTVFLSVCLYVLSLCNVGVLWPNGWMDQDTTWYGGRPRPRRHCVTRGTSSPTETDTIAPTLGTCLLWPNGRPSQQLLSSCYYKLESSQSRPHWLLLIYSFQFRSVFRAAPARHRHCFPHGQPCGFNNSTDELITATLRSA